MTNKAMDLLALTADVVSAHFSNNSVPVDDVPLLIQSVHQALQKLDQPVMVEERKQEPAVPINASIKSDYLVCLEDGAKLKLLKRYLRTRFDMSPQDYREKWGLPTNYPMVAPAYAEQRKDLAHKSGLGRKKASQVDDRAEIAINSATRSVADSLAAAREHLSGSPEKPARQQRLKLKA